MHKLFEIPSITLFLCAFCAFLWLKNPRNPCNPWLIKDLHASKALYICRDTFTNVMSALQIKLFMQNKANFRKSQMNVNKVLRKDYEKRTLGERGKKQSQTKPNKANLKKAKMNVTSILTKGYENKTPIRAPKKQSQISKRQKTMQTSLPQRIMKINRIGSHKKTKPNKANFRANIMLSDILNINRFTPRNERRNSRPDPLKPLTLVSLPFKLNNDGSPNHNKRG